MEQFKRKLLTTAEAAAELGLAERTVRQWIWRRKIDTVRIGRCVRVPAAACDALIERGLRPAVEGR